MDTSKPLPDQPVERTTNRRAILRSAAWATPVVLAAIATPLAAASQDIEVGAYQIVGTCGMLGFSGAGFILQASTTASLPADTTILIFGSGVPSIGTFSAIGGNASVSVLSSTLRLIRLVDDLGPGESIEIRTTLSTNSTFTLTASGDLPPGYVGTGSKAIAIVTSTISLCVGT